MLFGVYAAKIYLGWSCKDSKFAITCAGVLFRFSIPLKNTLYEMPDPLPYKLPFQDPLEKNPYLGKIGILYTEPFYG